MQLYLPCSRFRVRYILSIGTPYSKLDRLILRSVNNGVHTVEELSDVFKLNNSVLVQSLVTLIQAGWLALGDSSEVQFSLTSQGTQAINTKQIPKSIIYRKETTEILLEHVSGCLIPRGEVLYRNFRDLDIEEPWSHPQVLRTEVTKKSPEQGEVQNLLPRRSGERLHWIQDIQRISKGFECIPLDVDVENGKIVNFPSHRSLLLQEKIMGYAEEIMRQQQNPGFHLIKKKKLSLTPKDMEESVFALPQDTYELSWSQTNLLTDSQEMSASLLGVFEQAYKYLLIASREMSISFIKEIEEPLLRAVKRGVRVSMLWGNCADQESLDYLGKLAYKVELEDLAGQLSYNKESCKFNAALVLFDKEKLIFEAIIGNHDWLSSSKQNIVLPDIGFRICHPEIAASLARIVGGYASEISSHSMQELANQWKRIAADISSTPIDVNNYSGGENEPIQVRLVQSTSDHLNAFLEFAEFSSKRFYVLSGSLDSTGKRRLAGNSKFCDPEVQSIAVVGLSENSSNPNKAPELDCLYEYKGLNTNVIATDNAVCITSSPPLLGMDLIRAERNLGIVIYGREFAKTVLDQIEKSTSAHD